MCDRPIESESIQYFMSIHLHQSQPVKDDSNMSSMSLIFAEPKPQFDNSNINFELNVHVSSN